MSHQAGVAGVNRLEQRIVDSVDDRFLLDTVADLVRFRSLGGAETPAQRHIAEVMRRIGMDVDEWDIDMDTLAGDPDFSSEVQRHRPVGVVGRYGGTGPILMLNGHIDVVPVGEETLWSTPPWEPTRIDGRIAGRGTVDMKGGLACALAAVDAVVRSGVALPGAVTVASVVGEEDGGTGTLATLMRGHRADAAVVVEPTAGEIAVSQAGALGFRLTIPGLPAHGALREEGVSALEKFHLVHDALLVLERARNDAFADQLFHHLDLPLALSIGTVRAGEWASTVPDRLECEGRYGVAPGEDIAAAKAVFEATLSSVADSDPWLAEHRPTVMWWGGQFHPATTPPSHPLVTELAACHARFADDAAPVRGVPYGSDLRHLVNRGGIPSVLYGPGDVRLGHAPNESVAVDELVRVARTLALLITRFCGD